MTAIWEVAKWKGRPEVCGESLSPIIGRDAGSIGNACKRSCARAGDHVYNNPILFQRTQDTEVCHSASGTPAERQANLDAPQVMNDSFQAVCECFASWSLRFEKANLEVAGC